MTPTQFEALSDLLRLRQGAAKECARLALVDNMPTTQAAQTVGLKYRTAAAAVRRARDGLEMAKRAAG